MEGHHDWVLIKPKYDTILNYTSKNNISTRFGLNTSSQLTGSGTFANTSTSTKEYTITISYSKDHSTNIGSNHLLEVWLTAQHNNQVVAETAHVSFGTEFYNSEIRGDTWPRTLTKVLTFTSAEKIFSEDSIPFINISDKTGSYISIAAKKCSVSVNSNYDKENGNIESRYECSIYYYT